MSCGLICTDTDTGSFARATDYLCMYMCILFVLNIRGAFACTTERDTIFGPLLSPLSLSLSPPPHCIFNYLPPSSVDFILDS